MEDKIKTQIETLKKQREDFVAQANNQVAALTGAIQALEALLADDSVDSMSGNTQVISQTSTPPGA